MSLQDTKMRLDDIGGSVPVPQLVATGPVASDTGKGTGAHTDARAEGVAANTSYNFEVAKVASILLVALGHFLPGRGLWVPITVALFVFGFASGFFTAARYHERFDLKRFWQKKIVRLGPNLLVINGFLLGLFLIQGKQGIWTWQTVLNVFGLTGVLNWFGLPDPSPFGAGLWFFTLLLLFYAIYPALRLVSRSRWALGGLGLVTLAASAVLNEYLPMGHMLWLTAWSFIFGVIICRTNPVLPARVTGLLAFSLAGLMVILNLRFGFNTLNYVLLVAVSIATVLCLKEVRLPRKLLSLLCLLSGCLLEIYFLHSYLFARGTGTLALDLIVSFACIIVTSWVLSVAAEGIRRLTTRKVALVGA